MSDYHVFDLEFGSWGEEGIAAELSAKLGILVSPRTVRAYWPQDRDPRGGKRNSTQHWRAFVRNHARAIVAADFLVAITAGFRLLYVLVIMEVGSRCILLEERVKDVSRFRGDKEHVKAHGRHRLTPRLDPSL